MVITDASDPAPTAPPAAARAVDLTKTYGAGDAIVRALDGPMTAVNFACSKETVTPSRARTTASPAP